MLLGVIGDDFTGSTDIANTLAKGGMRVTQYVGVPAAAAGSDVEAGVVSLKTRTVPVRDAVDQSLAAADWLLAQGCGQLFFKYCSTFDSTPQGNIGPVTEALMDRVGENRVVMCPAFPAAGRTVYQGHLFVFDTLLSESGMRHHPLTPMTDPDLRRWLAKQTSRLVSHLPHRIVAAGAEPIRDEIASKPPGMLIADAMTDADLRALGQACAGRRLLTGGSGLAIGLPRIHLGKGTRRQPEDPIATCGRGAVLSGSCSTATRGQIAAFLNAGYPAREISATELLEGGLDVDRVADWAEEQPLPPVIYSSADPETVVDAQRNYGRKRTAAAIEGCFGALACALASRGIKRLVTAGGETSGAVVLALGISSLGIGAEIATGVPVMHACEKDLCLALKSGNFGGKHFFVEALEALGAL